MSLDPSTSRTLLTNVAAFSQFDTETLDAVAEQLDQQQLATDEVLLRQGEPGEALYFVLQGELEVAVANGAERPVLVDRLGPGAVIGEMALLAGNRRSATVTARSPATVARLTRAGFDLLAALHPGLREQFVGALTPRLERIQLANIWEQWFGVGSEDSAAVHELQQATTWVTLPAGETLCRPGDPADGMFIVVSGRLEVTTDTDYGTVSYQVGRGESVGESAVLGDTRRQEVVTAVRDSHLLRVPASLVEARPAVMRRIARTAVRRVGSAGRRRRHGNGLRSVALLPTGPGAPLREVAGLVQRELRAAASVLQVDEAFVSEVFGGSVPSSGSALGASLTHWLNELELEHDYLLLLADQPDGPWAERCRRQADAVLVVGDGGRPPSADVRGVPAGAQLVLLHPAGTSLPSGTMAWLERTGTREVHHLRPDDTSDVARLVRRLTGRATGLVFSGGGARGYAHIGLLRAIDELGIVVDMVAGTSMGALIAAGYAFTGSPAEVERFAVMFGDKKRLLDRTLPLVALTRSQGVTDTFTSLFGDQRIEDLWLPFACVSANLYEAVPVEHRTGLLWEAVRASSAIPGIFTPLVKNGALLVDGAVMNAFPVDLMREMVGPGTVIASSTMSKSVPREPFDFGPSVSGWEALRQYLRPRSRRRRYPTMIKTLMEATSVGSKHQSLAIKANADLVVELPVQEYSKLEFHRHEELIELGYRHAYTALETWLEAGGATANSTRQATATR